MRERRREPSAAENANFLFAAARAARENDERRGDGKSCCDQGAKLHVGASVDWWVCEAHAQAIVDDRVDSAARGACLDAYLEDEVGAVDAIPARSGEVSQGRPRADAAARREGS